jgi:hypothetical protein
MEKLQRLVRAGLVYGGITTFAILAGVFLFHDPTFAQTAAQSSSGGIGLTIARIFQVILGVALVVALGFLVYGAFLISSAEGEEIQIQRGKRLATLSGIIFIILAVIFGLLSFLITRLSRRGPVVNPTPVAQRAGRGLGGFPSTLLEAHYPENGQKNLARNTGVMITFTEAMDTSTLLNDNGTPSDPTDDLINTANVKILKSTDDLVAGPFVPAKAQLSDDKRTILFSPLDYLGSAEQNSLYTVFIGEGVASESGLSSFAELGIYSWEFEVGTHIDLDPPHVVSIFPSDQTTHPRNAVVQITFNEAMNPLTVMGSIARGFDNITIKDETGETIPGRFVIANQYRTVEFVTDEFCGTNSCEQDIFCLPGNQNISVLVTAATVSAQPPSALFPFDGVTDSASNSLDGDFDGSAVGSPDDDYAFSFETTNEIDKSAPVITLVKPSPFETNVSLTDPLQVTFNKALQFSTISRRSVQLPNVNNYTISLSTTGTQSSMVIEHTGLQEDVTYTPAISSDVKDLYQNCYRPCIGP